MTKIQFLFQVRVIYAPDVPHNNESSNLVADIPEYQWIDLTRFDVLENQVKNFSGLNKISSSKSLKFSAFAHQFAFKVWSWEKLLLHQIVLC